MMEQLLYNFEKRKTFLKGLFEQTLQFISKMSEFEQTQLLENLGDYRAILQGHITSLQNHQHPVLLIGDDCQGKKDLIELLIHCKCAALNQIYDRRFCYLLSYNSERYVQIERWIEKEVETTATNIFLDNEDDDDERFLQQIDQYMTKYEKDIAIIKIYWPIDALKRGIQYVSFPWSISLPVVSDLFIKCLSNAFGVIFVLQIDQNIIVDITKVNKILQQVWHREKATLGYFLPDSTIFICNTKAEGLEGHDIKAKKDCFYQKMDHYWPNCSLQQFLVVNITNAVQDYHLGIVSQEYHDIIMQLQVFLPYNLTYKLELFSRWLQYLLSRISYNYHFQYVMSRKSLESRKLIASELQARLNNIEMMTSKDDIIRQLNTNIVFRQEEVLRDLWKFIQSDDDITYILQESLTDKITSDENITYHELIQLAKTTMTSIIIGREDIQDYFNQLGYYLIQQYKKKLFRMQSLLENFERGSLCNLDILQDYDENKFLYDDQYTTQEKVIFDLISPLWVPSRFSTNLIQSIEEIDDDEVNEIIANYCQHFDSEKLIKEKLIVWFKAKVISIMEDSFQRSKVIEAMTMMMKPVIDSFDNYFSILPTLFQFYRNLLQHILSDDNHTENVPNGNDSSNQLLTINQHLSRLVMLFNVRYVRQAEFNPNQLVGYDENYSFDHNSTAAYSTCQLRNKDVQFLPITLKIFNRKVSSRNIIKLLSEEEALRKLNHKNILTFYGLVSLEDRVNNFTMACEICHCSLKKFFDFQNDCIPADFPFRYNKQQCAYRKIKIFALQIAAGLCYIHNACYVHPDLYLDNILLSIDNTIKLCDPSVVFQSASIDSIKNSLLPIYPAPEYLAGNVYNHKCDMYHYGLILHEMWYNKPLIDLSNSASLSKDTVDKLLQGVNPDFSIYPPPPDLWQYIITKCLQFDPNERLSSSECYKALQYRSDYEDPEETTSPIIC